jgi:hypothetical protein
LEARLATLLCKKLIVEKVVEVQTGWSNPTGKLADCSKEGCGSKKAFCKC